jgi:hypothetical protein
MAREATLAQGPAPRPSVITCYNYGKVGHKYLECPEPRKPGAIHEIDEEDQGLDIIGDIDEESGKEDP